MSKYNRKHKKASDDEFVDFWTKLGKQLQPYARAIAITIGTAVVVWFIAYAFMSFFEHKAQVAAEQFGKAVKIYDADLLGDEPAPKTDDENPIPRFKTDKERADASLAALDVLDKKWGGSDVARDALVFRAGIYYDLGRYDDAIATYGKFLKKVGGEDASLSAMAKEGIGLSLEAQNKLDDALQAYQGLEPKSGDFYRDRALYDQARIYKKKGDKTKAASLYNQILAKMPQSLLKDDVQQQLAILESP